MYTFHAMAPKKYRWELYDLLRQIPESVLLEVYLDTCHSGAGLRGAEFGVHAPRARFVAPPGVQVLGKPREVAGFALARAAEAPAANHILWSGCKANQSCADAYFEGRYNGAFTHHYVKAMTATQNKLSRGAVMVQVRAAMKGQFAQEPQLECSAGHRHSAVAG